jgi:ATP-binding cassette, subfamily B, multidrug efflux pump
MNDNKQQFRPSSDTVNDYTPLFIIRRLFSYLHPYRGKVVFALVLSILSSAFMILRPYLIKVAIDEYIVPHRYEGLALFMMLFIGVYLSRLVVEYLLQMITGIVGQYVMHDLRMAIFSHILSMEMGFFDRNKVGRLMTRTTDDVASLNELYTSGAVSILNDAGVLLGIVIMMFVLDWRLTLITLTVTPFMYLAAVLFARNVRILYRNIRRSTARVNAFLQESIQGVRVIKQMMRTAWADDKFSNLSEELRALKVKNVFQYGLFFPVLEFIGVVGIVLILGYGGNRVLIGGIEIGILVAFMRLVDMFFFPIRELAENFNVMLSAMASSERIFTLLDTKPSITNTAVPAQFNGNTGIVFDHVWFAYNGDNYVLKDMSFNVTPGERVAFVGPTGAGKSTIMQLLLRYYEVNRGRILIGGIDIREYSLADLRSMFAHVGQDPFLFNRTVRENISLGEDAVNNERISRTLSRLQIDDFTGKLENGLDTLVNERGSRLSLGEKQLVSIARAMASERQILILDEATSSIDTFTDTLIQKAIPHLMEGRTALVIAHRLSTVRTVDTIHVIVGGGILESGNHDDLMQKGGVYARLRKMHLEEPNHIS